MVGDHSNLVQGMPQLSLTPQEPLIHPAWVMPPGSGDGGAGLDFRGNGLSLLFCL